MWAMQFLGLSRLLVVCGNFPLSRENALLEMESWRTSVYNTYHWTSQGPIRRQESHQLFEQRQLNTEN